MNIDNAFPDSNLLKAEDIGKKRPKVTIQRVTIEMVGSNEAPVISFVGKTKRLKLNRTNKERLKEEMGPETSNWKGAVLELYCEKAMFQGKMVDGIRLNVIEKPEVIDAPDDDDSMTTGDDDDDIPF